MVFKKIIDYEIEIIDEKFDKSKIKNISEEVKELYKLKIKEREKTAKITFIYQNNPNEIRYFGYVPEIKIYKAINKEYNINLNYCYVDKFSTKKYCKKNDTLYCKLKKIWGIHTVFNKANFENARFKEDVIFHNSLFLDNCNFIHTKFFADTKFVLTEFLSDVNFLSSEFYKNVTFEQSKFYKVTDFNQSVFYNDVDFFGVEFYSSVLFTSVCFLDNVNYEFSSYHKKADFSSVKWNENLLINKLLLSNIKSKSYSLKQLFKKLDNIDVNQKNDRYIYNILLKILCKKIEESYMINEKKNLNSNKTINIYKQLVNLSFSQFLKFKAKFSFLRIKLGKDRVTRKVRLSERIDRVYVIIKKILNQNNIKNIKNKIKMKYEEGRNRNISFLNSKFYNIVTLENSILYNDSYLDFNNSEFHSFTNLKIKRGMIKLNEVINRDIIDFRNIELDKKNIKKLNLFNIKNQGTIYLDWNKNNVKNAIDNGTDDYEKRANQYRMLKENYRKLGQYEWEDKAYYEFKRNQLKAEWEDVKNRKFKGTCILNKIGFEFKRLWDGFWYPLKTIFFKWIGGFGTKPLRIFITMLVTVILFGIGYKFIGDSLINTENAQMSGKLLKSFYHSAVTFLTIGYGDIQPASTLGVILSGIEGFVGLFLMSYFTVAFVRKVLR